MFDLNNYRELHRGESVGTYGAFGIQINVAATNLPSLDNRKIRHAAYDAVKLIEAAVMQAALETNPEAQERAVEERRTLLGLFQEPIYVEDLPNGSCNSWCCAHLPWFLVTTKVGRIKIGWRKRVINIDWTETRGTKTSEELFENENVTKEKRLIHAWSLEKAQDYIKAIMSGRPLTYNLAELQNPNEPPIPA